MSWRWPKFLPGWPAVLLMPVVMAAWAIPCYVPKGWWSVGGRLYQETRGFPLAFKTFYFEMPAGGNPIVGLTYQLHLLVIDIALGVIAAYGIAMILDRLIFPLLRR